MSINYRCEKNFSKTNLEGGRKRGIKIFLGDHASADRCRFLLPLRVLANHPSQRSYRHLRGYILFDDGSTFDLSRRTVAGEPRYIFHDREEIQVLAARLRSQHLIRTLTTDVTDDVAPIVAELVLQLAAAPVRASVNPTGARDQIRQYLPSLGTAEMEAVHGACAPVLNRT